MTSYTISSRATLIGSTIQKSATATAWDASVYSGSSYTGQAYVSATTGQINLSGAFGLNSDPATNNTLASIDYAWVASNTGIAQIYENGALIGSFGAYTSSDLFSIASSVSYLIYKLVTNQ